MTRGYSVFIYRISEDLTINHVGFMAKSAEGGHKKTPKHPPSLRLPPSPRRLCHNSKIGLMTFVFRRKTKVKIAKP